MGTKFIMFRYEGWRGKLYGIFTTITDIATFTGSFGIIMNFILPGITLTERCLSGFAAMITAMSAFKTIYYYFNRVAFENLLLEYEACFPNDEFNIQLDKEVEKYSKMFRPVIIITSMTIICTQIPWCFLSFLNGLLGKPRVLAVPSNFLIDITTNRHIFMVFSFVQTCTSYLIPVRNVAFDDIFYCYSARQLALFSHLEKCLNNFLQRYYPLNEVAQPRGKQAEKDFINWVKNHQHTLRLMEELQRLFSPVLLVYFSLISLSMCMSAFIVSSGELDNIQRGSCGIFAIGNITGLFFLCRVGDLITYKSAKLKDAFLGKFTVVVTKREFSILNIILTRCQIDSKMSAIGVFFLNSETFQSIMMSTYSYYTLLQEIKN